MYEFEELRDDVLSAYVSLTSLLPAQLAATRRRLLTESRDRLVAGQFYVVVCGEFRRGKSSLLNALVERPALFPVDVDITTSAVILLRWAAQDSATVFFAETDPGDSSSAREPQVIPVGRAAEFVTEQGNPGNHKQVLRIEMGAPIPQLKTGMVLVDTPGVGSLNPAHTAATRAFLRRADAVLFVASATEPLGVEELNFLQLALSQCPIVMTAITMIDKVVDPAPVVAEARTRIAGVAGIDAADLVLVPVSSFRKRDAMEDHDEQALAESGFPQLEDELWAGLAVTCGAAQVRAALGAMDAAVAEAVAPVDNQLAALRGDWAKTEAELREQQEKFRRLQADAHSWKRGLQEDIDSAVRPVRRQLDSDLDEIREQFREALGRDETVEDASRVIQQVSEAMVDAADRASSELEAALERVASKYVAITELSVTASGASVTPLAPALNASAPPKAKDPQGYARFREMWMGSIAGGGAGALVGSVVGPLGTAVGGVVGFLSGLFGGRQYHKRITEERQRRAFVAELRENVLPKLEAGRRRLLSGLAEQIRDYSRTLTSTLEDEITARGDSLAASVRSLDETRQRDAKSRADTEHALIRQQEQFTVLRAELGELRGRADSLPRRPVGADAGAGS
jgi:hypothetical protein